MSEVDATRFPRLTGYLGHLPNGLGSYPECQARGAVVRSRMDDRPIPDLPCGALPSVLLKYFREPPTNTSWVPHVHMLCISLVIADWFRMSDEQYFRWSYDSNKRMFKGAIYRFLMSIASPATLLSVASARWASMHRGTTLEIEHKSDHEATVLLRFPVHLFNEFFVCSYGHVFKAALELSEAKAVVFERMEVTATTGRLRGRWA